MERITLAHGDGGELAHQLIQQVFVAHFHNDVYAKFDSALFPIEKGQIAMTTDSFVVKPLFFPGGNIGKLSVAGTVNDLAVSGAIPKMMTCSFIIEEGFPLDDLTQIVHSMAEEAKKRMCASSRAIRKWSNADLPMAFILTQQGLALSRSH